MLWLSILVSSLEGMEPPLYKWWGSLFRWVGAFHVREVDYIVILPDMGVTYPFHSPHFYLALPTMTQFCDWSHSSWGSLSASINGHGHRSLCLTYVFLPRSAATSCYLWSSPILSGCSSRHPWQKLQLPIFPPQGSFTGRSSGDCLTTFHLWHPLFSPLAQVVLHGVGLVHLSYVWQLPIHKGTPISDAMRRSWFWWRTHDLPCWFITL